MGWRRRRTGNWGQRTFQNVGPPSWSSAADHFLATWNLDHAGGRHERLGLGTVSLHHELIAVFAWRPKHCLLTTIMSQNHRRAGNQSDEKLIILQSKLK
jgi:hypothetical protein